MSAIEHLDIIIVGAGLSGVGGAYYLQKKLPEKSYAILENRDRVGGTWDLFRYPGIRSDSDMLTMGYSFKPWISDLVISEGHLIRDYIEEAAKESNIDSKIRFKHNVLSASWSSDEKRWTLDIQISNNAQQEPKVVTNDL